MSRYPIVAAMLLAACAVPLAQKPTGTSGEASMLAIRIVEPPARPTLTVTSTTITAGGAIPRQHSDYDQNVSPPLKWSGAPATTKSYVLLMEDPDAEEPKPFVHWVLYNLPPSVTSLPEALTALPKLKEFGGALQGRTSKGNIGYFGPRPPKPDPPHHYHFQVFALDSLLQLDPGAGRSDVLKAIEGHVVAAGELMGTFKAPPDAK